jgi:hypothetical protein
MATRNALRPAPMRGSAAGANLTLARLRVEPPPVRGRRDDAINPRCDHSTTAFDLG